MSVVVFGSARGAPGVTTTAAAVAACLVDGLLVEADCDGGVLALRYELGREPGITTLAAAGPDTDPGDVAEHTQHLPGGVAVLVGPESADRAGALWQEAGGRMAALLGGVDGDVVVDAGRLSPTSPARCLVPAASLVVLVARPCAEELVAASQRLGAVRGTNPAVALVLVGERPYSPSRVAAEVGCEVLGVVADDPKTARALVEGVSSAALARSALARSAATVAGALVRRLDSAEGAPRGVGDGQITYGGRTEVQR